MEKLQAPWVGLCEEDYCKYSNTKNKLLGFCNFCGQPVYENSEYYGDPDGDLYCCEECKNQYFEENKEDIKDE